MIYVQRRCIRRIGRQHERRNNNYHHHSRTINHNYYRFLCAANPELCMMIPEEPNWKELIVIIRGYGIKMQDIADFCGMPLGTLRNYIVSGTRPDYVKGARMINFFLQQNPTEEQKRRARIL